VHVETPHLQLCNVKWFVSDSGVSFVQEHIPVEEVFQQLRCNKEGLSDEEATARLAIFGHNKLEEKSVRSYTQNLRKRIYCSSTFECLRISSKLKPCFDDEIICECVKY